jgi:DNA-binding PucR family transcriptional regulator
VGENDTDAPTPPELRERIAQLAAQVRELAEPAEREQPPPARAVGSAGADEPRPLDQVSDALIAAAERAAAEIRERALAEAARIASARLAPGAEGRAAMEGILERQRETLDALAAETARLEQGVEVLRAQIAALDSELERMRRHAR